ncbi:hypothetical protein JCM10213_002423 [Rhodosporidiobolus nylandii]
MLPQTKPAGFKADPLPSPSSSSEPYSQPSFPATATISYTAGTGVKLDLEKVISLRAGMPLSYFDEGKMFGGDRAWQLVNEEIMRRFYSGDSPQLVSASRPHEWNDRLQESAFIERERHQTSIRQLSGELLRQLEHLAYELVLEEYEAKSVQAREDVIIKALATSLRSQRAVNLEWARKLAPELQLHLICKPDMGLRRFFKALRTTVTGADWTTVHQPHPWFDRKFALDAPADALPLSKSCRAFQRDMQQFRMRELLLSALCILDELAGRKKAAEIRFTGLLAEELTPESDPYRFNEDASPAAVKARRSELIPKADMCMQCGRTAEETGQEKLQRCSTCSKVGRVEQYCSSSCQRAAWKTHKPTCGKVLSEL